MSKVAKGNENLCYRVFEIIPPKVSGRTERGKGGESGGTGREFRGFRGRRESGRGPGNVPDKGNDPTRRKVGTNRKCRLSGSIRGVDSMWYDERERRRVFMRHEKDVSRVGLDINTQKSFG